MFKVGEKQVLEIVEKKDFGYYLSAEDASIRATFEKYGMETLDMFSGVPYIEAESDDQETCYNEHF